ncbi:hypothetical protein OPV22_011896 [Ensete ventricosum]|uniref:Uncharacterized protein n=1 Tax=Ensete ventricosum TaxID=4639 RepID=A0AAV8RMH4_ENSVE|nr:hypothetical protein OPV22_011896 [Ensete ventricosum]
MGSLTGLTCLLRRQFCLNAEYTTLNSSKNPKRSGPTLNETFHGCAALSVSTCEQKGQVSYGDNLSRCELCRCQKYYRCNRMKWFDWKKSKLVGVSPLSFWKMVYAIPGLDPMTSSLMIEVSKCSRQSGVRRLNIQKPFC